MKKPIPHALLTLLLAAGAFAQSPPPPPPPPPGGGNESNPGAGLDLSSVPKPEADKPDKEMDLTPEEKKSGGVMISILPVGFIPPPIIKLDASGMPRETYRNPMEFPPAIYQVKTSKTTVKIIGAQNQIGPSSVIPRMESTTLYYESPPDPKDTSASKPGDRLRAIGKITIPPASTHLLVVLWKDANERLWNAPHYKVVDVSTASLPPNGLTIVNVSPSTLQFQTGKDPYKAGPGYIGRLDLPLNGKGEIPLFVGSVGASESEMLSRTTVGTSKDSRVFLIAWEAPRSRANPTGVMMTVGSQLMPPPKLPGAPPPAPN